MKKNLLAPLPVELEMKKEAASAMRRVATHLEKLIAELHATRDPKEHAKKREEAKKYYWYLMVQREAIGLRNHDDLKRLYVIPPAMVPGA